METILPKDGLEAMLTEVRELCPLMALPKEPYQGRGLTYGIKGTKSTWELHGQIDNGTRVGLRPGIVRFFLVMEKSPGGKPIKLFRIGYGKGGREIRQDPVRFHQENARNDAEKDEILCRILGIVFPNLRHKKEDQGERTPPGKIVEELTVESWVRARVRVALGEIIGRGPAERKTAKIAERDLDAVLKVLQDHENHPSFATKQALEDLGIQF